MKVLVTGGAGFLGAWVIDRFQKSGAEVRVLDMKDDRTVARKIMGTEAEDLDWRVADIRDGDAVKAAAEGCDSIAHLAALLTPDCAANPVLGAQVLLIGTLNVFQAAKAHGMKSVAYASSGAVFGGDDGVHPYPVTHYAAFKLACEGAARAYWQEAGIASVGFRPAVIYGPFRETGMTAGPSLACRAAASGDSYHLGYSGAADMIFVDDVAAAFHAAATHSFEGAHALNLKGEVADVADIAAAINALAPATTVTWKGDPIPMHPELADSPLETLLGALPRTSLRDGLAKTIEYYRQHSG
ncbi:NAD-dependent epimerase/dehydratase family protein [Hwanghaeella sp.]|uniref:NAD-dependent epimerase/dehydratase family protein n=1 Tax=Hwanghaeella sp. TaxID=2605943 RepID=UPI003CCBD8A1